MPRERHAVSAGAFLEDGDHASWHDETLWWIRTKRDKEVFGVPEWESLREAASEIKRHALSKLDAYLLQLEEQALQNGIRVHWAKDATEHNQIVYDILQQHKARRIVKSKSMLTEECHLNSYLEARGIQITDTDLGEYIVQIRHEHPSHIVLPAIHLKKEQVSETFHTHIGTEKGETSPDALAAAASEVLRSQFFQADAAITGVNFAVAENGTLVICTNEGNADMGMHHAKVHIACMGIEKVIPSMDDLPVFLRLLARSATGQPSTAYTSHIRKPGPGQELHLILVDNGRTDMLAQPRFRDALKCIRCGACFNTCPVYRRSGGHSYHTSVAGPIGSVLSPGRDMDAHGDLPFASTLCGSCSQVCPVKIDLHGQLWHRRQEIHESCRLGRLKRLVGQSYAWIIKRPRIFQILLTVFGMFSALLTNRTVQKRIAWTRHRDLPPRPSTRFDTWYAKQYEQ